MHGARPPYPCKTPSLSLLGKYNQPAGKVKGGFVPLIKDWKDLMSEVSEKQSLCGSLKDSRFFGPFKDQVDKFEEKLALLDELLLCMNKVQRKWVYLEPIFGRGSLPREKERFDKVNNQYRQIMKNVGSQKKVNYLCSLTLLFFYWDVFFLLKMTLLFW